MSNFCNECDPSLLFKNYRIVNTISERNTIPCEERVLGMIVTVIGSNTYKQYMLKGGDPCNNSNWQPYGNFETTIHVTVTSEPTERISDFFLNTTYPNSKEGFMVTYTFLNTTFMKIAGDNWVITNSIPINHDAQ